MNQRRGLGRARRAHPLRASQAPEAGRSVEPACRRRPRRRAAGRVGTADHASAAELDDPVVGRALRRARRSTTCARTRASRARSSTRTRSPSSSTPSARSGCCSRSSCARSRRRAGRAHYELVAGERRWRASREAGLDAIPAIVRETADDALLRDALLENLHRAQLNALEEAAAYQQLLEDFGCTQDELATRIGRSRPQVSNTLRLLRLPPPVQRRVAAGVLSAGHARALLALDDPERDGRPRHPHRRRGALGARGRGDRRGRRGRRPRAHAGRAAPHARRPPGSPRSPTGSPTGSRPACASRPARARARSPSSSRRSTTSRRIVDVIESTAGRLHDARSPAPQW